MSGKEVIILSGLNSEFGRLERFNDLFFRYIAEVYGIKLRYKISCKVNIDRCQKNVQMTALASAERRTIVTGIIMIVPGRVMIMLYR